MTWERRLRPGSFRGVPFFIDVSKFTTGRRVQVHEFLQAQAFVEDFGGVTKSFEIDAHMVGDYWNQKDAMIEAVNKEGPGELVHPYFGTLRVQVGACSIEEDTQEGRLVKIKIQFYLAGENKFPIQVNDGGALLVAQSQSSLVAARNYFNSAFSVLGTPKFVVDSAAAAVEKVTGAYTSAFEELIATPERIAELAFSIRNLRAQVFTLIQQPELLSARLENAFDFLERALEGPSDRYKASASFFNFESPPVNTRIETSARQAERRNSLVLQNYQRQLGIINAAKASVDIDYPTLENALEVKDALSFEIDKQLESTDSDEVYQSFRDLKASIVDALPDEGSRLPSLIDVTLEGTKSSLEVTYDLYESLENEQDVLDRNSVENPGFIVGGQTLKAVQNV